MTVHDHQARSGAHGFLACSQVLEFELLPRLSARELLCLSSTSKPMQRWLMSTPPCLWQVMPWVPGKFLAH